MFLAETSVIGSVIPSAQAIRERLEDAEILWNLKRINGAFTLAFAALSGLSRIRYPQGSSYQVYFDKLRKYHPTQHLEIARKEQSRDKTNPLYDGEAFMCIALDLIDDIVQPPTPRHVYRHDPESLRVLPYGPERKETNVEEILYKAFRCMLFHESQLSPDVQLTEATPVATIINLEHPLGLPEMWAIHLIHAIRKADEILQS
jgi:hypothetical protein